MHHELIVLIPVKPAAKSGGRPNNGASLNQSQTSFGSDRGAKRLFTGSIPMLRRENPMKSPIAQHSGLL
jgi:hypothetical protein